MLLFVILRKNYILSTVTTMLKKYKINFLKFSTTDVYTLNDKTKINEIVEWRISNEPVGYSIVLYIGNEIIIYLEENIFSKK